jgi:hypothetical protein
MAGSRQMPGGWGPRSGAASVSVGRLGRVLAAEDVGGPATWRRTMAWKPVRTRALGGGVGGQRLRAAVAFERLIWV